ncbi:MAG TPA: hypothetical protein VJB89_00165 [Candidatus Nanoarchaeia archaeon]|nr:hypothetical protein [Candidatus Nanoarchaeia archaeon]
MKKLFGIILLCVLLVSTFPFVSAVEEERTVGETIVDGKHAKEEYREELNSYQKYDFSHTKLLKKEEDILQKCKSGRLDSEFCAGYSKILQAKMPGELIRTADGYVLELGDIALAATDLHLEDERKDIIVENLETVQDRFIDFSDTMSMFKDLEREGHSMIAFKILERITNDARAVVEATKTEKFFSKKETESSKIKVLERKLGRFIGEKEAAGEIDSEIINDYDEFVAKRAKSQDDYMDSKDSFDSAVNSLAEGDHIDAIGDYKHAKINMKISEDEAKQAKVALKNTIKGIKEDFGTQ